MYITSYQFEKQFPSIFQHWPAQICVCGESGWPCEMITCPHSRTVCGRWPDPQAGNKPRLPPWPDEERDKDRETARVENHAKQIYAFTRAARLWEWKCDHLSLVFIHHQAKIFIYSWDNVAYTHTHKHRFQPSSHYLCGFTKSHLKILHDSLICMAWYCEALILWGFIYSAILLTLPCCRLLEVLFICTCRLLCFKACLIY